MVRCAKTIIAAVKLVTSKFLMKKKNRSDDFLIQVQWFHSHPIRFFIFNHNDNLPHIGYVRQLMNNKLGKMIDFILFHDL